MTASEKSGILRARILGCGSSGGVPRFGGADGAGDWGACDPGEPKNRRQRCSLLLERFQAKSEPVRTEKTRQNKNPEPFHDSEKTETALERTNAETGAQTSVLIDTSPDMREQLLNASCRRLDAVLFTHHHADQCHGIDDLRVFALAQRARVPVYIDDETSGEILDRFSYCFVQPPGSYYTPILERRTMPPCGERFEIEGPGGVVGVTPFLQYHGGVNSLGFRVGDIAYSSDVVDLPEESFAVLTGVKTWIVDALQMKPHGTHAHLDLTLEWIARVRPERAILTNLHVSMDYRTLIRTLPAGVEPAYDGMLVTGSA